MITFQNVSMTYGTGHLAIRNVEFQIEDGEFVFLVGPTGSGKSTCFRLLLKEIEPTEGEIQVDSFCLSSMKKKELPRYRRNMGVVFQDFRLLEDRDVYENIALAQRVNGTPAHVLKKEVPAIIKEVGLGAKYRMLPSQLSGGEKQKVAIARALLNRPPILLADEPTGNLDPKSAEEIMSLLEAVNEKGTTVVVITHNLAMVEEKKKRVISLNRGCLVGDVAPQGGKR